MLTLRAIAGRIVMAMHGETTQVKSEMTLDQACAVRDELDRLIEALERRDEQPGTLLGLIAQIGVVA